MPSTAKTPFIITIDTEGDNLWSRPRKITTRNAAFLPRFQELCERFGFKPVYLTNHEMAESDLFAEFGRDVAARGKAEIGMHLHAWNSPPLPTLTADDYFHQPYLVEYPDHLMKEKIRVLTRLLEDRFEQRMVSHRAGRWAFDGRYAEMLRAEGYLVDCSVTPGINWRSHPGDPSGQGGTDYRAFPQRPYFIDPSDISKPAAHGLLEVPMTIRSSRLFRLFPIAYRIRLLRRLANAISPETRWLCPLQPSLRTSLDRNFQTMLKAVPNSGRDDSHLEFMVHSSELMPGGSPEFRSVGDIDRLYAALAVLFEKLSRFSHGMTLREFHAAMVLPRPSAPTSGYGMTPFAAEV